VVGQQRQRARGLRDANSHDPQGAAANERQIAPDAVVLDYKAPPASVCSNSAGRSIFVHVRHRGERSGFVGQDGGVFMDLIARRIASISGSGLDCAGHSALSPTLAAHVQTVAVSTLNL
jgi:hypothetical protein